jgi:predicted AAA+ superfamily ATPase
MLKRALTKKLKDAVKQYPVVTLTGPRQSGKTTLVKMTFPNYDYRSLEDPDHRAFALEDPRGFLSQFPEKFILDEIQRAPDLASYIQTIVDTKDMSGQFILTGSQNFLLGLYPIIHDESLDPVDWLGNYFQTYIERTAAFLKVICSPNSLKTA